MAQPAIDRQRRAFGAACLSILTLSLAMTATPPAAADTLLVEAVQSAASSATERPRRGMSMQAVESRFGAPTSRRDAVGKPPITRWDYADYSVFFEYQHVIHAVPRR